ncbi:hypothetical protein D3C71_1866560 [compost metagenome]
MLPQNVSLQADRPMVTSFKDDIQRLYLDDPRPPREPPEFLPLPPLRPPEPKPPLPPLEPPREPPPLEAGADELQAPASLLRATLALCLGLA